MSALDTRLRRAFTLLELLVVVAIIAVLVCTFLFNPLAVHVRWYDRVRGDIHSLAHKRPPEVSKGQWEFVVGWTNNLHGNCGSVRGSVDLEWRFAFEAELKRRLQGPITLADVEWIWDEYAKHTSYGQTYSDRWHPLRSPEFPHATEGVFGMPVD